MINKETLVNILNEIENEQKRQYDLNLNLYIKKCNICYDYNNQNLINLIIKIISEIFNDDYIIDCWIYQLNFGKAIDNNYLIYHDDETNENINICTIDVLYECLVKNYNKKQNLL